MVKSMQEAMCDIVEQYQREGNEWPATKRMIAEWAVANRCYELPLQETIDACIRDLGSTLSNDQITDPQGRSVRRFIAAKKIRVTEAGMSEQQWFWDDVRTATHEHVVAGFESRREAARRDVRKLQIELESYNANLLKAGYEPIDMTFDFNELDDDEQSESAA